MPAGSRSTVRCRPRPGVRAGARSPTRTGMPCGTRTRTRAPVRELRRVARRRARGAARRHSRDRAHRRARPHTCRSARGQSCDGARGQPCHKACRYPCHNTGGTVPAPMPGYHDRCRRDRHVVCRRRTTNRAGTSATTSAAAAAATWMSWDFACCCGVSRGATSRGRRGAPGGWPGRDGVGGADQCRAAGSTGPATDRRPHICARSRRPGPGADGGRAGEWPERGVTLGSTLVGNCGDVLRCGIVHSADTEALVRRQAGYIRRWVLGRAGRRTFWT
jgi:hypothetical protein